MQNLSKNPSVIELTQVDVTSSHDSSLVEVEGVDWRVNAGDFWVIGGPNTSGKSNLLATAVCLQRPFKGSIRLFGNDISRMHASQLLRERLRMGIVFKGGGKMFGHLTVSENIGLPLCYQFNWTQARAAEKVEELIQLTGLSDYAHVTAENLSAVWQQRVGLARALALKPEVLFLDEPLTGLELRHRRWWQDFLVGLNKGIAYTEGRPLTLAVATNDFERWTDQGRQFATIKEKTWRIIGGVNEAKNLPASEHE